MGLIHPTKQIWHFRPQHLAMLVLLVLLSIEIYGRVTGYFQIMEFSPAPAYGYRLRPHQEVWSYGLPVQVNAYGLRGKELEMPTPEDVVRIAFVGDSVCYGGGRVAEETLFLRRIENALRAEGLPVEVVNISAPGWAPQNWAGYVGTHGYLDADLVVYVILDGFWGRPLSTLRKHGFMEHAPLLRMHALAWKLRATVRPPGIVPSFVYEEEMQKNLRSMRFLQEAADSCERLFLRIPLPEGSPFISETDPEQVASLLMDEQVLDLRKDPHGSRWFMDALHLAHIGHQRVAEKTVPVLRKMVQSRLAKKRQNTDNTEE